MQIFTAIVRSTAEISRGGQVGFRLTCIKGQQGHGLWCPSDVPLNGLSQKSLFGLTFWCPFYRSSCSIKEYMPSRKAEHFVLKITQIKAWEEANKKLMMQCHLSGGGGERSCSTWSLWAIFIPFQRAPSTQLPCKFNSLSVISSVLAFCPSVTLKKRSYEGFAPPWKLSQIVEIRFRKFQGIKIVRPNHFSAGVLSKMALFAKMSVRYANIFTSLIKTRAWFEIASVW